MSSTERNILTVRNEDVKGGYLGLGLVRDFREERCVCLYCNYFVHLEI